MLDGRYSAYTNRFWELPARALVRTGWSPNAVTIAGLALVALAAGAYLAHRNNLIFALCLVFAFAFDGLDGAVARLTGRSTKYGGYLDAVIDRYQEALVLAAVAWVNDLWPAAFLVMTGGFLTSYNKARVALEIPVDNLDWPDLIERLERLLILIALLALDGLLGWQPWLSGGLVVLGVLTHVSALQRFMRARLRLLG